MKIRTDFVSNSSSSSFIVMDSGNVDDIFKENHLTWTEYVDQFFDRDILDSFSDACYVWSNYGTNVKFDYSDRIKILSDEEFLDRYMKSNVPEFAVLEQNKDVIPDLCRTLSTIRKFETYRRNIKIYCNGKVDKDATIKLNDGIWKRKDELKNAYVDILNKVRDGMLSVLNEHLGDKMFWYAECGDDGNGTDEMEARSKISDYQWYRYFNNH